VSLVASDSATTQAAPQPRAWVTRGQSAQGQSGCGSSACAYFVVNTRNFPPGNYRYECWGGGSKFNTWEGPVHFPADGQTQLQCYYGMPGAQVWVVLNGTRYETTTW
jgi:hypothetical protein